MSSRPLFIIVAESTLILAPIDQLGWATACSGVIAAISSRLRVPNGPPLAVSTSLVTSDNRLPPSPARARHSRQSLPSPSRHHLQQPPPRRPCRLPPDTQFPAVATQAR